MLILLFQTCKQLNAVASSSLNIGFTKADRLHAVIQREVLYTSTDNYYLWCVYMNVCVCGVCVLLYSSSY